MMRRGFGTRVLLLPGLVVVGVSIAGLLTSGASASGNGARAAEASIASADTPPDPIAYVPPPASYAAAGRPLFEANCASCHAADASGNSSIGAPNLQGLGPATVDFWVSTGRMPLADATAQPVRHPNRFTATQTLEIVAFVSSLAPTSPDYPHGIPFVNTGSADIVNGNSIFVLNCAGCHTITGSGDALSGGFYAPSLHSATKTQVAEAIRTGPTQMPHFGPGTLSDKQVADIVAYVTGPIQHPANHGGLGLGGIGPVEGSGAAVDGDGSAAGVTVTSFDDPILRPYAKNPRRAEMVVAGLLLLGLAGFAFYGGLYWVGGQPQWEGVFMGVGLFAFGFGLSAWGKYLLPQGPFVEERHPLVGTPQEQAGLRDAVVDRGVMVVRRRGFLGLLLGAGSAVMGIVLGFPLLRSLGPTPNKTFDVTNWKTGSRLVDADGRPIHVTDLEVGGALTVFPEGFTGSAVDQTMLVRADPSGFTTLPGREGWTPDGYVAYSKLCTHAGCPVGLYEELNQQLLCPCHQSLFDVKTGANPVFGPAPRPLPQLALKVDSKGFLRAQHGYTEPVGPGFWER